MGLSYTCGHGEGAKNNNLYLKRLGVRGVQGIWGAGAKLLAQGERKPDGPKDNRQKKNEQGRTAERQVARPVEQGTRAGVIKRLLKSVEKKLSGTEVKATLGDYIKLVQLQKEMDDERQPREIKVTWVEPGETKSGTEE